MGDERKYVEFSLDIGESIRIGDTVVSVIETQDNQAAVLVEELNFADDFGSAASISVM